MNETEALAVMQSDMKLWETAATQDIGDGVVIKTLTLPWGIGDTEIRMEGLTDAIKKRGAVEQYGNYIRSLIEDQIDDEAIEARAKQAAARAEQGDSEGGGSVSTGGTRNTVASGTVNAASTAPAYSEDVGGVIEFGATLIAQRATLRDRVGRAEANLATWRRELRALDAACAALEDDDAPTDSKAPQTSEAREVVEGE